MSVFPVGSLLVIWILLYAREGPTCESAIVSRVAFDLRRRCLPKRPLRRAAWGFLNRAISRVPPSECQGNSFRGLPVSNKDRRGVHQKLEATVRSGVAVPKDIKLFGRTDVYQWIKPYQSVEDTNTLERLHAERSETPSLEPPLGLLGVKSFFLPFDLVLQRTGFEPYLHAYLEAIRAEQLRQEQDRAEESRLRRFGYREGIFVDNRERRPPEDLELNLLREAEGVDGDALALEVVRQLERFRQEQKEQLNKNREEPRGGGLVVVCYLPGVSAADIKVQLALPGRHIVREEPKAGERNSFAAPLSLQLVALCSTVGCLRLREASQTEATRKRSKKAKLPSAQRIATATRTLSWMNVSFCERRLTLLKSVL